MGACVNGVTNMCHVARPTPDEAHLNRWMWGARWQLTRLAQDHYATRGRGIVAIISPSLRALQPDAEGLLPASRISYLTPDDVRQRKPTHRVSATDLEEWIRSTQTYNPATHWVGVEVIGDWRKSSLIAPLTTLKSDARSRFSAKLTVRPLPLDLVRAAARDYYDELYVAGYPAHEIDATGREEMIGYRYCFTHYDKVPLFGLQIAAAIAEGFHIDWRLVDSDVSDPRR